MAMLIGMGFARLPDIYLACLPRQHLSRAIFAMLRRDGDIVRGRCSQSCTSESWATRVPCRVALALAALLVVR